MPIFVIQLNAIYLICESWKKRAGLDTSLSSLFRPLLVQGGGSHTRPFFLCHCVSFHAAASFRIHVSASCHGAGITDSCSRQGGQPAGRHTR